MQQVVNFLGVMNGDDSPEMIIPGQHMHALNGRFKGSPGRYRFENVEGTTLISNSFLPAGANVCIGGFYDQVRNRIFFANRNSNNDHAIYMLDVTTRAISIIIQNGVNTDGDILDFDLNPIILNWNIVYGDQTQGDVLFFVNTKKEPCQVNIDRALAGGYGNIQRSFIDVCREQPDIPPQVCYQNDVTVTVNNLRKKLFKFKYRFVFDNKDKSAWSAQSEVPLPLEPFDHAVDTDPTKNCVIPIVVQTGKSNVKKIEIAACVSNGNVFSDFFSIITLNKSELSIPNDDITTYLFYNDRAYINVDPQESILDYDDVPLKVNAQELLNGNTLLYGGATKNYDNLSSLLFTLDSSSFSSDFHTNTFNTFFATQDGKSAFGSGNIHIVFYGIIFESSTFTITLADSSTISYSNSPTDTSADIINGLMASALSNGFIIISFDANNLIISKANAQLALVNQSSVSPLILHNSSFDVYDWWARNTFGIQYLDIKGRPVGGVQTNSTLALQTIPYQEIGGVPQLQKVTIGISHTPPIDAYYYNVVRTKNLVENAVIYWISDRTFKDTSPAPDNFTYAYVSIANLNTFVKNNPGSPLGYTFAANDRIRFVKLFNGDGTTNQIYTSKDYEIIDAPENPTINGVQYTGQFIKIVLPTTSVSFDFGGSTYANYVIKLYTPAKPVDNGLDAFYEYSERFAIINPGENSRYHQGETQNQDRSIDSPAIIETIKGDYYYRERIINTGVELIYQITGGFGLDSNAGRITLGCVLQSSSYNDPNILTGSSPFNNLIGFNSATNNDRWIIKIVTGTFLFRIKGTIIINFSDDRPSDSYMFFLEDNTGVRTILVPTFDSSKAGTYTFQVDTTFTLTSTKRIFIFGYSIPNDDHTRSFTVTNLTITAQKTFTQGIIDPNFSDYFPSLVNSNGRARIIEPDTLQTYFPTLIQWGGSYEPDTNINQISRFYPSNFDEIDRQKGDILRFKARDRICRIFQSRGVGQVGVYTKFIQDSGGTNTLTTTDTIITSNNIQYYAGEYGLENHPESLVSGKNQDYFIDPLRGYQIRLSNDGFIPISEIYKGQYSVRDILTPYNKEWTRADGSIAKLLGAYNYLDEEYICVAQTGTNGLTILTPYTFSFNELRNAYSSYFDYDPEYIMSAQDMIVSFKNGDVYFHDNTTTRCNFYGTQFPCNITIPFNINLLEKKTWEAIGLISNTAWDASLIYTNSLSYPGQRQETSLISSDFKLLESMYHANLFRDVHSLSGLFNGDTMKGNWAVAKFEVTSAAAFVFLSQINMYFLDSQLTTR